MQGGIVIALVAQQRERRLCVCDKVYMCVEIVKMYTNKKHVRFTEKTIAGNSRIVYLCTIHLDKLCPRGYSVCSNTLHRAENH